MKRRQTGFTMIELIVVIVILGILAATALPKFVDLRGDAVQSATDGMAGQLGSAMAVNYTGCQAANNVATANKCITINNCSQAATLLTGCHAVDRRCLPDQWLDHLLGGRRYFDHHQRCHRHLHLDGDQRQHQPDLDLHGRGGG